MLISSAPHVLRLGSRCSPQHSVLKHSTYVLTFDSIRSSIRSDSTRKQMSILVYRNVSRTYIFSINFVTFEHSSILRCCTVPCHQGDIMCKGAEKYRDVFRISAAPAWFARPACTFMVLWNVGEELPAVPREGGAGKIYRGPAVWKGARDPTISRKLLPFSNSWDQAQVTLQLIVLSD